MQIRGQSVKSANLELFAAFVKHMPVSVAMLDRNLRYLLASSRWLTDYALENQDIVGRCHYEVFPLFQREEVGSKAEHQRWRLSLPHPLQRWQEIYALGLAGEAQQGDSDYVIRPDGSLQRIKWEIQPWHTSTGEIGGIIMFSEFQEGHSSAKAPFQEPEESDRRLRKKAIEEFWETASLAKAMDATTSRFAVEQLQQEIAERRQAQALQQESEERYRSLIAALAEGIIVQDSSGVIRTCNTAAERILGLSTDQLLGMSAMELGWRVVKENGNPFSDEEHPLDVTLRTGEPLTDAIMVIDKLDGTQAWLSVNSQPLFRPNEAIPYAAVASFIDISKRKQVEVALRESEERFRATFEQAAVGITHASINAKFVRVNQKFCDIVGYTREELLERTFYDITHPDDIDINKEYVRSLLAGEIETYSQEKRYVRKDGQSIWVQTTVSLVQPPHDEPKYLLAVVQDISIRKTAEYALRQSEAQLREQAGREFLLNRLSTQIRNSLELNTILETTVQEVRQILQIDRCQFAWYHPHETKPYWEVVKEAHRQDLVDRTGFYPAEIIGPLTEQLLNLEIVKIDDVETVSNPISRRFIRALGCSSVLSLPMQTPWGAIGTISCIHSSVARPWLKCEVELLQSVMGQLLIAMKQADLYAASRRATQQAQEQATQLEQTLHELQRTQAQLIQIEKMSSLGQLVAGVAHEINNPVNFIYGNLIYAQQYSQDLLGLVRLYRDAYPNPPIAIKEQIDSIDLDFLMSDFAQLQDSMKVGAERIREIVRSLRTFSRLDESDSKEVDIHAGIESTLMILQNRLKGKAGYPAIAVMRKYGDLPLVECYAGQLNQVFMNLLTNALDALEEQVNQQLETISDSSETLTYPSPTITISTGVVGKDTPNCLRCRTESLDSNKALSASESPSHIFIRITDNGAGMTQKTQQQLYNPFFTTKPVGRGTGLGLAICYQIVVEKHGGQLRCNSAPGQGAEFIVEIPIKQV